MNRKTLSTFQKHLASLHFRSIAAERTKSAKNKLHVLSHKTTNYSAIANKFNFFQSTNFYVKFLTTLLFKWLENETSTKLTNVIGRALQPDCLKYHCIIFENHKKVMTKLTFTTKIETEELPHFSKLIISEDVYTNIIIKNTTHQSSSIEKLKL